jgi:predicted O-methyltransferase YrrM
LNSNCKDEETNAIRDLNRCLRDDKKVELCTLPIGDGVTIVTKLA